MPHRMQYISPSFAYGGEQPRKYSVQRRPGKDTIVHVEGMDRWRMVRTDDWTWELRSAMWTARAVRFSEWSMYWQMVELEREAERDAPLRLMAGPARASWVYSRSAFA